MRKNQVISTLDLIYFGSPQLVQTIKTNRINFTTVDPEICPISISALLSLIT